MDIGGVDILIAVKAQMNLRVRTYSRGVRGHAAPKKMILERLWCVFVCFSITVSVQKKYKNCMCFFSAFDTLQIKESVILQTVKFMRLLI